LAPQVFTITTAGEARDREDSILGRMLDGSVLHGETEEQPGLQIARYAAGQMLVYNYEAPTTDPRDLKAMKLANPASWITTAFLAKQAANHELSDAAVLQLHGCVWAAGRVQWLPGGVWRPLERPDRVVEAGEEVILGFDGSYNNDSTALVGCTLDGHLWVEGLWERPPLVREWFVPRDEVELAVHRALEKYRVRELACDPPGWVNEIQEWVREYGEPPSGPVFVYETNKPSLMSAACSRFYTAILEGEISHDGNPDLARHLANAVVKETRDGAYITKDGRHSRRKIDLAVAAVVAYDRAMSAPPALVPLMAMV
jgi:phage terminase large subunit-like protein